MNKEYVCLIGIDPDVNKSGVALYDSSAKTLELSNLAFFDLYDYLAYFKVKIKVYIEAGWLNKSNWHVHNAQGSKLAAKIGSHVGANHAVGIKIVEMCEYLKIDYELIIPKKSKVNASVFAKITGIKKTNQEQRDAAMLVYGL